MRIVIDTNVLISAFLSSQGVPARVFRQYELDTFELLVSEPILTEYQQALNYPKVHAQHQMSRAEVTTVIENFRRTAMLVSPKTTIIPGLNDADDNKFFACAVAGGAEYIISGDRLVQDVGSYQGIQVLSPALFLSVLENKL